MANRRAAMYPCAVTDPRPALDLLDEHRVRKLLLYGPDRDGIMASCLGSVSRIMAVGYRPEPVQGFDEVECGLVMAGQLVVTGGQPAPVLAAVEAAFHLVASAVGGAVEVRWPAAGAAAPLPVGDLVVGFRDDSDDVPRTQQLAVGPRGVRLSPVSESGCSRGLPIPPGRATATWFQQHPQLPGVSGPGQA
jgi:hypothetical protein